jgi:branched-chain amino acid transport system substrate-binding protein
MTGQYATYGAQIKNGVQLAVDDINAAGGVLGRKLDVEIGDDACDPKQAESVADQLTAENVALVAGHFCSGSSIPASKVYAQSNLVQISPACSNPAFTDDRAGPNIYRVTGRDDQQGAAAAKYLAQHFADKKIAIVDDQTAYGKGLADDTERALRDAGVPVVYRRSILPGEKDYSALVTALKMFDADVVFYGTLPHRSGIDRAPDARSGLDYNPDGR